MPPELFAFLLTLLAGLSTGIGSAIAFVTKRTSGSFLATALGFSAGVMLFVSFVEIYPQGQAALISATSEKSGRWLTLVAFFTGIALIAVIDRIVPDPANPHERNNPHKFVSKPGDPVLRYQEDNEHNIKLLRMGVFTAISLALHNFPEGFATFLTGLQDPQMAIPIAIAIAIHNIPEGIAVSVPVYYATGDRKKAFGLSFASGLSEPLGAVVGYLILRPFINDTIFGFVFVAVAGIMIYISIDQLLPTAREYGKHHHSMLGLGAGMAVMGVSLALMA